jgi:low temperature requirement protein LtrA
MSGTYDGITESSSHTDRAVVAGFTTQAGILLLLSGFWRFFAGLAGIIKHHFYAITPDYAFKINVTTWGWIHLVLGIIVFAAGVGLLAGQTWARVVGVVLAVISAVENFLFLPYYPFWAILVIAVDLMIIWALLVYGRVIGSHEA